ncbi:MAG: hypothetical protein Q4F18_07875 [Clostridia bacterium]|nr:hypothetical protein [Clostridia bacterium]
MLSVGTNQSVVRFVIGSASGAGAGQSICICRDWKTWIITRRAGQKEVGCPLTGFNRKDGLFEIMWIAAIVSIYTKIVQIYPAMPSIIATVVFPCFLRAAQTARFPSFQEQVLFNQLKIRTNLDNPLGACYHQFNLFFVFSTRKEAAS